MADPFEAIRAHVEKHGDKERATFSIAGIQALLAAVDAALSAASLPAQTPVVRELEWHLSDDSDRWVAVRPFDEYIIVRDHRASAETTHGWFNEGQWLWASSLAEAKAACQADFEARIRSALTSAAASGPSRQIAWLIERKENSGALPSWYAEKANGWHWWTPIAAEAKRFTSEHEAKAYPAYQMIATDTSISVTEHVFIGAGASEAEPVAKRLKRRIDYRLNDALIEMKPEHDDSITGFNEAWDIVSRLINEELALATPPVPAQGAVERAEPVAWTLKVLFKAMQKACANYIEPTTYIARFPDENTLYATEFAEAHPLHSDVQKRVMKERRDAAFISDIIRFLDGPEQREAQASPPTSPDVVRLRKALAGIANQRTLEEINACGDYEDSDFVGGYDAVVGIARAALAGLPAVEDGK